MSNDLDQLQADLLNLQLLSAILSNQLRDMSVTDSTSPQARAVESARSRMLKLEEKIRILSRERDAGVKPA